MEIYTSADGTSRPDAIGKLSQLPGTVPGWALLCQVPVPGRRRRGTAGRGGNHHPGVQDVHQPASHDHLDGFPAKVASAE
jgi:hypothetical protein